MTDQRPEDREAVPADSPRPTPSEKTGRPTAPPDDDGLRAGQTQQEAPTVAPEEQGETPETEHAPGGDL
jgi:hypothetical protein